MTNMQESWDDFASKMSALGLKMKLHYEQERSGDPGGPTEGLRESAKEFGDAIEDAFESFGNAIDDSAVRDDAKEACHLLLDALSATFTEVSDEVRDAIRRSA